MSRDEDRQRPAKGQQWTATGAAGAREYDRRGERRPGAQVRLTPGRRTAEKDAYHEACRQKLLAWDPVVFGAVEPGECVLIRCPRYGKCFYGSVDMDELWEHFERSGHYDPDVDELDATIINPVYDGEEERRGGAYE